MQKVKLRGYKKGQNSEEFYRLQEVTGGIDGPYSLGEDLHNTMDDALRTDELERLDEKVAESLGRQRGYIISPEEARRIRLRKVNEKIAEMNLKKYGLA